MTDPKTLGQRLRTAREAKDLTLEEAERGTRIRARFIDLLERGDYSGMTPVQVQGFLRNYARFLGVDFDLMVQELESAQESKRWRRKRAPEPESAPTPMTVRRPYTPPSAPRVPAQSAVRRWRARLGGIGVLLVLLVLGVVIVALVYAGIQLMNNQDSADDTPTQTAGTGQTPAPGSTATAAEPLPSSPTPDMSYTPPTLTGTEVTVEIEVLRRTKIYVMADGADLKYDNYAEAGEILRYTAAQTMYVQIMDASAVTLTVNNIPQGTLGERGASFVQLFTLAGAAPPAVTPTPTTDAAGVSALPTLDDGTGGELPPSFATNAASPTEATLLFTPPDVRATETPTLATIPAESISGPMATG